MKAALRFSLLALLASLLNAQTIRLYSDFQRFDPYGNPVAADRDMIPREILSPAMARNGHLSLQIVITGPANSNYLLYAGANPPGILQFKVYREYFTRCGNDYCPDWLAELKLPSFGAIPEYKPDFSGPEFPNQSTRCYLLDIYAPAGVPPRRARVEALLKAGTWLVAPMEVRIMAPAVPADGRHIVAEDIAPVDAPASETAAIQLFRYLGGLPPEYPRQLLRVRDIIQRNAAEDMLVARALGKLRTVEGRPQASTFFPEMNLLSWSQFVYPELGAEWYLKVRDFLYRFNL